MLEVRDEELEASRQLLAAITYPIIEVKPEILCVPLIGPVDVEVMAKVTETVMDDR